MAKDVTLTEAERTLLWRALHDAETTSGWYGQPECKEVARLLEPAVECIIVARSQHPEGVTVTEWGVRWVDVTGTGFKVGHIRDRGPDDRLYATKESAHSDSPPGTVVVSRRRNHRPDVVTEWAEVTGDTEAGGWAECERRPRNPGWRPDGTLRCPVCREPVLSLDEHRPGPCWDYHGTGHAHHPLAGRASHRRPPEAPGLRQPGTGEHGGLRLAPDLGPWSEPRRLPRPGGAPTRPDLDPATPPGEPNYACRGCHSPRSVPFW